MMDNSSNCSDDSDSDFVRADSPPLVPVCYLHAPEAIEFKLKIKPKGSKSSKFMYTLKKDQDLPYCKILTDGVVKFNVVFGNDLKPSIGENWQITQDDKCWILTGNL